LESPEASVLEQGKDIGKWDTLADNARHASLLEAGDAFVEKPRPSNPHTN
jgi:hypothetical protein